jgi:hypothetical protein
MVPAKDGIRLEREDVLPLAQETAPPRSSGVGDPSTQDAADLLTTRSRPAGGTYRSRLQHKLETSNSKCQIRNKFEFQ